MAAVRTVPILSVASPRLTAGFSTLLCFYLASQLVSARVLFFRNVTIVNGSRAFHLANETFEVTCVLPAISFQNEQPCFFFGGETYNTSSRELTVLNKTAVKFSRTFETPVRGCIMLSCLSSHNGICKRAPDQYDDEVSLYVNYGLLLAQQHANCTAMLPNLESLVDDGKSVVSCSVTIDFNLNDSYFLYDIYIGTGSNSREKVLRANNKTMPLQLNREIRTTSFLNASVFIIWTQLQERFSGRSTWLRNEISVVDSIKLPKDIISWDPLENGTGFILSLNFANLAQKCDVWEYSADIKLRDTKDVYNKSRVVTCSLCTAPCQEAWTELKHATNYSAELRHRLFLAGSSNYSLLQAMTSEGKIYLRTAELEPVAGPTVWIDLLNCTDKITASCMVTNDSEICHVVMVNWKELPEESLRGALIEYQMNTTFIASNGSSVNFSTSLPPSQRTEDICWYGRETLVIKVAGRTTKGYPPPSHWGSITLLPKGREPGKKESEYNSLQTAAIIGGTLGMVIMLLAATMCIAKGRHYRAAWKNRLRIPKIKPSAVAQHHAAFLYNPYMEQFTGSLAGLNKLDQSISKSPNKHSCLAHKSSIDSAIASWSTSQQGQNDERTGETFLYGYLRELAESSDAYAGKPPIPNFMITGNIGEGYMRKASDAGAAVQICPYRADWHNCGSPEFAYIKDLDFEWNQESAPILPRASCDDESSISCLDSPGSCSESCTSSQAYQRVTVSADEMRKLLCDDGDLSFNPSVALATTVRSKNDKAAAAAAAAAAEEDVPLRSWLPEEEQQQTREVARALSCTRFGAIEGDAPTTVDPTRHCELISLTHSMSLTDQPAIGTTVFLNSDYVAAI